MYAFIKKNSNKFIMSRPVVIVTRKKPLITHEEETFRGKREPFTPCYSLTAIKQYSGPNEVC